MELQVSTLEGKKAGSIDVSDDIFGLEPRSDILHRMVRYQLAKRQLGTSVVQGRSDVTATGARVGRQKGGGTARHGPRKVNLFRGGGRSFGPLQRSHAIGLPRKIRALALRHALSSKVKDGSLVVMDKLDAKDAKTSAFRAKLDKLGWTSVLVIDGAEVAKNVLLAARNIPSVDVLPVQGINVYDILRRDTLVLTKAAIEALEARFK